MSLLHMEAFGIFQGQTPAVLLSAGYDVVPGIAGSKRQFTFGTGRLPGSASLRYSYKYNVNGTEATKASKTVTTSASKVWFGICFKATERMPILAISGVCTLHYRSGISIAPVGGVETARGDAIPTKGYFYYYEIEIDKVANVINVYINDELDISAPLPATVASQTDYTITYAGEATYDPFTPTKPATVADITDLYICDNAGSGLTARLGPLQMTTAMPTADYLITGGSPPPRWTPASGNNHWDMVDNRPPVDTAFIGSNVSGAMDLFTSGTALPDENLIIAYSLVANARKTDIDRRAIGLVVGGNPATQQEVQHVSQLDETYKYLYAYFDKGPGGATWTNADALQLPFGVVVRP